MKKILEAEAKAIQDKVNLPGERLVTCPNCLTDLDNIKYGEITGALMQEWGEASNWCRCQECNAFWVEVWEYKKIESLEIKDDDNYA